MKKVECPTCSQTMYIWLSRRSVPTPEPKCPCCDGTGIVLRRKHLEEKIKR